MAAGQSLGKRRNEPRYAYPKTIEYSAGTGDSAAGLKGVVVNISRSGICLYLYMIHPEGQTLSISSDLPVPSRAATVKWIKKVNEGFYKAGCAFISS